MSKLSVPCWKCGFRLATGKGAGTHCSRCHTLRDPKKENEGFVQKAEAGYQMPEKSSLPVFFQNKDGTTNWGYIILLICMFSCCLIPQCGGGGSTSPNLPSESEWNRMTPEEKGKRIADEARKEVYGY